MRILLATRSAHKLREIREMFSDLDGLKIVDLTGAGIDPLPEEDEIEAYDTFEENALAKARYFAGRSGLPVLADDSGLCVDALGGQPGVRSRRFSGHDGPDDTTDLANNRHLLERMDGVPAEARGAHYVCCLAFVDPSGSERTFRGTCHGSILTAPRGDGGFGYDPLFFVPDEGLSFGEMPAARKNAISHRARALQSAHEFLAPRARSGA
jgi:XTP/dITP diphosphohydrolase